MPKYQSYPTSAEVPSRKARKAKRTAIFLFNSLQAKVERRTRREARKKN